MFPPELYEIALSKEFDLSYYGHTGSIDSWQSMPIWERDWHHNKLVDVKQEEKRQHEEAEAKIRQQTESARSKTRRRK
jgi:hypothetical protein